MMKKFVSFVLVLVLAVVMLPVSPAYVYAEIVSDVCEVNGVKYSSVTAAINATVGAEESDTSMTAIKLLSNTKEIISIDSTRFISIDLNGFVINGNKLGSVINNQGTLTITDSGIERSNFFIYRKDAAWEFLELATPTDIATYTDIVTAGCVSSETADGAVVGISGGAITGGLVTNQNGGGINNDGTLTIEGGSIVGNTAKFVSLSARGGGIANFNTLIISDALICGNAAAQGGGIYSSYNTVNISNSDVLFNKATEDGGGIYSFGSFCEIQNCLIASNAAIKGGGIFNAGAMQLIDSSVCGNIITTTSGVAKEDFGGAGIYFCIGYVSVEGNTVVYGNNTNNAADNLFFYFDDEGKDREENIPIGISDEMLSSGAKIGVTHFLSATGTDMICIAENATDTDVDFFSSDDTLCEIVYTEGSLYLKERATATDAPETDPPEEDPPAEDPPAEDPSAEDPPAYNDWGDGESVADVVVYASIAAIEEAPVFVNPFVDVSEDDYYGDAVMWAAENGITDGIDDTHFMPLNITTRAQMVMFLWRCAGCPVVNFAMPFLDVAEGSYYEEAVRWGASEGLVKGMSSDTFGPDLNITRCQAITFLWRYCGCGAVSEDAAKNPFSDVAAGDYFYDAVLWAFNEGITEGMSDTSFEPQRPCTRAQIVTFIYRSVK